MKKVIWAILIILIIVAIGVGGWFLWDSLQKEKNKTAELENRLEKVESLKDFNVENGNNSTNNTSSKNNEISSDDDEVSGDLGEYEIISNNAIAKCLSDENWINNNISSSSNAQNKFIRISNINDSPAYVIDSNLNGNHTVALVFYGNDGVEVKKKIVSNKHKSISVDTEANILVLGNLKKYLDEGDSDDDISLNLIDEKGFTEYGYSAEVPVLDGQSVSYGAFKSRTESIKEQAIEIDLNKSNVEKYIK